MRHKGAIGLAMLAAVLTTQTAMGSGIILYELGTPDLGLAGAGYAARAQDAATLFKNPAGMSWLEASELQLGGQFLYGDFAFRANDTTTVTGSGGGEPIGWLPGGSLFYVHNVTDDLKLGLGAFSYFGSAIDYADDWVGRYYFQEGTLAGLTLMPAASYRLTDWLSVGAGLNAMAGFFDQKAAVNNLAGPDGRFELSDEEWGFGADVGLVLEPVTGTRLGIAYLSPVSLEFEDTPSFTGLGPGLTAALEAAGLLNKRLDLEITVPQTVMVSAYHEVTEDWAVMANGGWQDWSEFGKVDVTVSSETPTTLSFDRSYDDTWHAAVGTQYRLAEVWILSTGFAYDSSPVKDRDRTVDFPVGETYRIGAGLQWELSAAARLGAAYEFAWLGDLDVDQDRGVLSRRVSGRYPNSAIHFGALSLSLRF